MDESLIVQVLQHYFPEWEGPKPTPYLWLKARCPFHADDNPSASVSYERNAFRCHACGTSGDAYSIIAAKEGVSYQEAHERAAELLDRGDVEVSPEPTRLAGRRLFGDERAVPVKRGGRKVPSRVRRRTFGGT